MTTKKLVPTDPATLPAVPVQADTAGKAVARKAAGASTTQRKTAASRWG